VTQASSTTGHVSGATHRTCASSWEQLASEELHGLSAVTPWFFRLFGIPVAVR